MLLLVLRKPLATEMMLTTPCKMALCKASSKETCSAFTSVSGTQVYFSLVHNPEVQPLVLPVVHCQAFHGNLYIEWQSPKDPLSQISQVITMTC